MEDTGQPQLNAPVNASRPRHHDAIEHRRYNPAPVSFAIRTRTAATIASRPGVFLASHCLCFGYIFQASVYCGSLICFSDLFTRTHSAK